MVAVAMSAAMTMAVANASHPMTVAIAMASVPPAMVPPHGMSGNVSSGMGSAEMMAGVCICRQRYRACHKNNGQCCHGSG